MLTGRMLLADRTAGRDIRISGTGAVHLEPVRRRATLFIRRTSPTAATGRLHDRPPDASLRAPDLDLEACRDIVAGLGPHAAAKIRTIVGTREYRDGRGLSFLYRSAWHDVVVGLAPLASATETPPTAEAAYVADGTPTAAKVPWLLADLATELRQRCAAAQSADPASVSHWKDEPGASRPRAQPPPARAVLPVVLAPAVAGVLMHELIGHVIEELPPRAGPLLVGPRNFNVRAYHPRRRGYDDEGTAVADAAVVRSGTLQAPHPFGGLSQAAWHRGWPQARCTHLTVAPAEATSALFARAVGGLVATATSGAELLGRYAVLRVSAAAWLPDRHPATAFLLRIGLSTLPELLAGIGDDTRPGRAGYCVRGDQPLVSQVRTPSLLLVGAAVDRA